MSRELANWVQNATGRHIGTANVHPMPVDSSAWPWTSGGGGAVVVARLTAQKRIHLAIETTAFLASCGHDLPLTVVGDGPERTALERQVERLGIAPFVRFVGTVGPGEVARFLERADVMFFPAREEGFGLAAAEALMAGVPVVACWDGGGLLDVVPEAGAGRLTLPSPKPRATRPSTCCRIPNGWRWPSWSASPGGRGSLPSTWPSCAKDGIARRSMHRPWVRVVQWLAGLAIVVFAARSLARNWAHLPRNRSSGGSSLAGCC